MIKFLINMQKLYKIPVNVFCIIIKILPDAFSFTSNWIIIAAIIEKFIAVRKPLNASSLLTRKKCYKTMWTILVLSVSVSSTQSFCLKSLDKLLLLLWNKRHA